MLWLIDFYATYHSYLSFVFWAIGISLFYYFFISTFLEMNMNMVEKTVHGAHNLLGAIFSFSNTILYIFIIYFFAQTYVYRGANRLGILFLLIAWSFTVIKINKKFDAQPWFSFLLFNAAWLGILLLWFQN